MALLAMLLKYCPLFAALGVSPLLFYVLLVFQNRRPARFPRGPLTLPLFGRIGESLSLINFSCYFEHKTCLCFLIERVCFNKTCARRCAEAEGDSARAERRTASVPADDGPVASVRRHLRSDRIRHAHCRSQLRRAAARSARREG